MSKSEQAWKLERIESYGLQMSYDILHPVSNLRWHSQKRVRFQWEVQGCEKILGLVLRSDQSYNIAVVSNSTTFCTILMVNLYWKCCLNIAQNDSSREAWPLRPCNVCLFRMYIIQYRIILQTYPDQVFSVLWRPQNSLKSPKWPVNEIGSTGDCRTFIAKNNCH